MLFLLLGKTRSPPSGFSGTAFQNAPWRNLVYRATTTTAQAAVSRTRRDNQDCPYLLHDTAVQSDALPVQLSGTRSPLDTPGRFAAHPESEFGKDQFFPGAVAPFPFHPPFFRPARSGPLFKWRARMSSMSSHLLFARHLLVYVSWAWRSSREVAPLSPGTGHPLTSSMAGVLPGRPLVFVLEPLSPRPWVRQTYGATQSPASGPTGEQGFGHTAS
jgi:hypothetical protein